MKRVNHQNCHGLFAIAFARLCSGRCAIGPNYKRPAVDAPGNVRSPQASPQNSFGDLPGGRCSKNPICWIDYNRVDE